MSINSVILLKNKLIVNFTFERCFPFLFSDIHEKRTESILHQDENIYAQILSTRIFQITELALIIE